MRAGVDLMVGLTWRGAERWMHFTYLCPSCQRMWTIPDMMHPNASRCPFDYTFSYNVASIFVGEVEE